MSRTGTTGTKKRSRTRRAGESAFGLLLVLKNALMALLALLILVAGAWTSWGSAQYAMLVRAKERGTMTVAACDDDRCWGPYVPTGGDGQRRAKVVLAKTAGSQEKGRQVQVTVEPGTDRAVRTGPGGILYAWAPLGGALLLASLVVAGGLRMRRTAWAVGLTGVALLVAAFFTL
ncbi:hypothetical protein C3486_09035 [Streptomyces sp. Ru73]|uniref:hypothetical protein n=1 Tax=Streptomyces sp. Ru73 TaxID=2080748 RepID=UPI000CDE3CBA|nr:hypothetical protein [Streptomyces sp. Ru73]POX41587.1 hypothetical protein C3486_09035 [Streptomyces sp. Ru73]